MPKKIKIPKDAFNLKVTYEKYEFSTSIDCKFCGGEYFGSDIYSIEWSNPKLSEQVFVGNTCLFACPACAKKIAKKYDTESLAEWFPEQPARTREVVVAELAETHQEKQKEFNRLYIEQSRVTDKYYKTIHDLNEELRKIDEASQPKLAPCKICGSTNVKIQKAPDSFGVMQFFYECENGHSGTRAAFDLQKQAVEHWNEIMGGNNV